jgi:hypothetical protein
MIHKDDNGFVWYVNIFEVMELPDMFAPTVKGWLDMNREAWNKGGTVDSEWYALQAKDVEQLEARKDTLDNGMGVIPGINTHGRKSLHND